MYTFVAARTLAEAELGAFLYAVSLGLLVSTLPSWGLDNNLIRRGSRDCASVSRLFSEVLAWKTLLGVPTFAVVTVVASYTRPSRGATVVLMLVMFGTLLDLYSDAARAAASAIQRQSSAALALALQRTVTGVAAVLLMVADWGPVGLAQAFLGGSVVGVLAALRAVRRVGIRPRARLITQFGMRQAIHGSSLLGLSSVFAMLSFRVDAVLITWLLADQAVAAYGVAFRLFETVLFVSLAASRTAFPVMSSLNDPQRVRRALEQVIAVLAFFYVPFAAFAIVEAESAIDLLFGGRYVMESAPVLQWLAPAPLLFGVSYLVRIALIAHDRLHALVWTGGATAVINVALNLVLIPTLGIVGAAFATTATLALEAVLSMVILRSAIGLPRLWRNVSAALTGGLVAVTVLVAWDGVIIVRGMVSIIAYITCWYYLVRRYNPIQLGYFAALLPRTKSQDAKSSRDSDGAWC